MLKRQIDHPTAESLDMVGQVCDQDDIFDCLEKDSSKQKESVMQINSNQEMEFKLNQKDEKSLFQFNFERSQLFENQEGLEDFEMQENERRFAELWPSDKDQSRSEKSKIYAKNYRQKKKEQVKRLQEENNFLKRKIQDLSFRLKQTQIQLNKLRHDTSFQSSSNYQQTKQSYLKQIQKLLEEERNVDIQELLQIQQNFKNLNTFSGKHKKDLLNYLMSELLENLISDSAFYFIDSVIDKKGLWRENQSTPYRRIDIQILEFYDSKDLEKLKQVMNAMPDYVIKTMINFKSLWKKLYQDYLNIINQGSMLEGTCQPLQQKMRNGSVESAQKQIVAFLKLQLYFQKIKYRKDLRQLRQSWFKEFEREQQQNHKKNAGNNKKPKVDFM